MKKKKNREKIARIRLSCKSSPIIPLPFTDGRARLSERAGYQRATFLEISDETIHPNHRVRGENRRFGSFPPSCSFRDFALGGMACAGGAI